MRRTLGGLLVALVLILGTGATSVRAQVQVQSSGPVLPYRVQSWYAAPGGYGTSYGFASYGMKQTYSTFASPYGAGYANGYAPAAYLPGPYGVGLWAPNSPAARGDRRTPYYGTFARPSAPTDVPPPPFGVYAPAFGPGTPPVMYGW